MELARVSGEKFFSVALVQSTLPKTTKPNLIVSGIQWIPREPILFEAVVLTVNNWESPKKIDQFW